MEDYQYATAECTVCGQRILVDTGEYEYFDESNAICQSCQAREVRQEERADWLPGYLQEASQ